MADEIKQLLDMVAKLKRSQDENFKYMHKKFEEIDERFESVEEKLDELNSTQKKILNTMKMFGRDIKANKSHIERLEDREAYL